MVDLSEDDFDAPDTQPSRRRPTATGPAGPTGDGGRLLAGPARRAHRRRPGSTPTRSASALGPFLLLLGSLAPLGGALYRIIDLVGIDGLVATETVGPRLQLLGNAVNPLTGLLLVGAVVVAVLAGSDHLRMVAGTAVSIATLLLVISVSVAVAAVRDAEIFTRVNDAHVEVISYEIGSALVALGVVWLALWALRRTGDA